jgi:hypothetical protein
VLLRPGLVLCRVDRGEYPVSERESGGVVKFRKKPVVIDAILWDGTEACLLETALPFLADGKPDFSHLPTNGDYIKPGIGYTPCEGTLTIPTLEGDHEARPGDYIIRGVKGEFYPCKPDIFEMTYEAV